MAGIKTKESFVGRGEVLIFWEQRYIDVCYLVYQIFYFRCYKFSGNAGHYDGEVSPLRYLEMAAEWLATAIKLSPKKADLHFQLGQVLEEQHYVQDLYGIKPSVSVFLVIGNIF